MSAISMGNLRTQADTQLLATIGAMSSTQRRNTATMIGAFDRRTGQITIGRSGHGTTLSNIHPDLAAAGERAGGYGNAFIKLCF